MLIVVISRETAVASPTLASLAQLAHFTEVRLDELGSADAELLVGLRLQERYPADATSIRP